jgi:hypothetical protein
MDDRDDLVVDFRSLSAAKKHIDATYRLAHDMLIRMQQVSFHKSDWMSFGSTIAIPCLDESDETEFERFKIEEQRLYDVRVTCAKQLEELLLSLNPMKHELQRHVKPMHDILKTVLPSTLGTIALPNHGSGLFAFWFFYSLSIGVEDWGREYARILRSSYRDMMFGEIRRIVEKANESFPFTDAIHSTLFKRLNEERSLVLLRLKEYRELVVDTHGESANCGSVEPVASATTRKKRGRPPKGITPEEKRIQEAWGTGAYDSEWDCDTALGLPRGTSFKVLERLRKRPSLNKVELSE